MALSDGERKAKVLARRGLSAKIAKKLKTHPANVSRVVAGRDAARTTRKARVIRVEIARALRMPVDEVFPPRSTSEAAAPAVVTKVPCPS